VFAKALAYTPEVYHVRAKTNLSSGTRSGATATVGPRSKPPSHYAKV